MVYYYYCYEKKKFVLDIPDLAFSSDLFFERNQLEDKEEEFFFETKTKSVCVFRY